MQFYLLSVEDLVVVLETLMTERHELRCYHLGLSINMICVFYAVSKWLTIGDFLFSVYLVLS